MVTLSMAISKRGKKLNYISSILLLSLYYLQLIVRSVTFWSSYENHVFMYIFLEYEGLYIMIAAVWLQEYIFRAKRTPTDW